MNNNESQEQNHFFTKYYFATVEDFEKALKNPKIKELYDKMFEKDEKEEKNKKNYN